MICCSGVETVWLHGLALLASAQLSRPVHLVLDAPWGFALWGLAQLPRPCLIVTQCPSLHYLNWAPYVKVGSTLATANRNNTRYQWYDVAEDCVTAKTQVDSTGSGSEEVYIRLQ
jgi:hypothetical protein